MEIYISNAGQTPIYAQITAQIREKILTGELQAGDALPSIRLLAKELRISVISVKRAWEELERDGFIITAVGRGTFAASLREEQRREKRLGLMKKKLAPGLAFCRMMGADAAELQQLIVGEDIIG